MRKFTLFAMFLLFNLLLSAQQVISFDDFGGKEEKQEQEPDKEQVQTIMNSFELKRISGFGGPTMSYSTINGEFAFMMGGGGGILINNLFLGGYGEGLTNVLNSTANSPVRDIDFGHGGFLVGYEIAPKRLIHPVISSRIGWGAISGFNNAESRRFTDNVMVFVPTISAEINFTRFFKINIGAEYRQTLNVNTVNGLTNTDFSALGAHLNFIFGWF